MKISLRLIAIISCIVFLTYCKPEDDLNEWDITSLENFNGCSVYDIAIDQFGNKWFATSKGLAGYNGDKWVCYVNTKEPDKNKINNIEFTDITGNSGLMLATNHGLTVLTVYENLNVTVDENFSYETVNLLSDTVKRIVKGKADDIWFLTEKGLSFYDLAWHKKTEHGSLDIIPIRSAAMLSSGGYYCGRQRSGMIKFNYSDVDGITGASEWIAPYNGIILDTVNYIYKSSSDELWLACFGDTDFTGPSFPKDGLIRHTGTDSKNGFTYFNDLIGGLTNNRINCIDEANDGKIWLATEGGIAYQVNDTLFGNYSTNDGLVNNKVLSLKFDNDGNLWCGTVNGISSFKDGVFSNFFQD